MSKVKNFYLGARPKTLYAAFSPVMIASVLAYWYLAQRDEKFSLILALACLVVSLFLQIGVNYANDYSDGIKGTDKDRVGPMRLVGSGTESPKSVFVAMALSFLIASIAGMYIASQTSWWLILVGVACILLAWFYTGGKKPYGYLGFGELVALICFGFVATIGTFYALTETISTQVVVASFIPGMFSMAILLANNIRDIETDRQANKKTLATRIGENPAKNLFYATIFTANLAIVFVALSIPLVFLALVALLPSYQLVQNMRRANTPINYIKVLVMTSKLNFQIALFVSALVLADTI